MANNFNAVLIINPTPVKGISTGEEESHNIIDMDWKPVFLEKKSI